MLSGVKIVFMEGLSSVGRDLFARRMLRFDIEWEVKDDLNSSEAQV